MIAANLGPNYRSSRVASGRSNNVTCLVAGYPTTERIDRMLLILWLVDRDLFDAAMRHNQAILTGVASSTCATTSALTKLWT